MRNHIVYCLSAIYMSLLCGCETKHESATQNTTIQDTLPPLTDTIVKKDTTTSLNADKLKFGEKLITAKRKMDSSWIKQSDLISSKDSLPKVVREAIVRGFYKSDLDAFKDESVFVNSLQLYHVKKESPWRFYMIEFGSPQEVFDTIIGFYHGDTYKNYLIRNGYKDDPCSNYRFNPPIFRHDEIKLQMQQRESCVEEDSSYYEHMYVINKDTMKHTWKDLTINQLLFK